MITARFPDSSSQTNKTHIAVIILLCFILTNTVSAQSITIGEGGNAWTGNSSNDNTTLNRDTNRIMLKQEVDDYISYWRFDGSNGTTSYDENLTSNNNGVLLNMTSGIDNYQSGWQSSGVFSHSIGFDQINDAIRVNDSNSLDVTTGLTISTWIKTSYYQVNAKFLSKWGTTNSYVLGMSSTVGNKISGTIRVASTSYSITSAGTYDDNIWHHIVFTYNGTYLNLIIDGIQEIPVPITGSIVISPQDVVIGNYGNYASATYYRGYMDNTYLFGRAVSFEESGLIRNNTMVTNGNITVSYDSGIGNVTYLINVNATTENSNYTVWYANNGTEEYSQIGGVLTGNNSLPIEGLLYQNIDVKVILNGNGTTTPEISKITFYSQEYVEPSPPFIISWGNNYTNDQTNNFSISEGTVINFNATTNQSINTWNWYHDGVSQNWNFDNWTNLFDYTGLVHNVTVFALNSNGTASYQWNITVIEVTPTPTPTPSEFLKDFDNFTALQISILSLILAFYMTPPLLYFTFLSILISVFMLSKRLLRG